MDRGRGDKRGREGQWEGRRDGKKIKLKREGCGRHEEKYSGKRKGKKKPC